MYEETLHQLMLDGAPYRYRVLHQPAPRTHPIVLLGGVFQGIDGWSGIDEALAAAADVVAVDFPVQALTLNPPDKRSPDMACRAVEQVVDHLGAEQINLLGYSYGSVIAHFYAVRHPNRVARLVLGGVPAGTAPAKQQARRLVALAQSGQEQEFATLLAETMLCMDPTAPVAHQRLVYRIFRRTVLRHLRAPQALAGFQHSFGLTADPELRLRGVPTLVFAAAHDTLTPVANQRAFAATIDNSSFTVLEEADHLVLLEQPAAVIDLTLEHFQPDTTPTPPPVGAPTGAHPPA